MKLGVCVRSSKYRGKWHFVRGGAPTFAYDRDSPLTCDFERQRTLANTMLLATSQGVIRALTFGGEVVDRAIGGRSGTEPTAFSSSNSRTFTA